ncbi:uncharacterized protein BO72DRAFT_451326 [Aspergillus fijiensis CBS 313.89]|uniref:TLC domain-containing protein n=1 Tax=Aspergillus fijiensis CBS 313.89 TaxID=1448319 RepID=A0A8G1RJ77_9EURO|nr:uncharacterized protein BO72DRAFT_451326 [Aspergillus fijiensis CBS 313.89]RAK73799.1 hypothetical protein BO72DRAFT_451326 [Aspergillus fijiensis CBS 313.89]
MEPLYASSCHGQFDVISCRLLVRSGTFGPTLLVDLTVFCALLTQFVFTSPLLRGIYGTKFAALTPAEQRRVGLLHVGIVMKVWGFVFIAVPSYRIIVQGQYWDEQGLVPGMTLADMATTSVMAFGALGLFDLIYSESLRPIYLLHHLGTLVFLHGYLYMVMSLPTAPEKSAEGLERLALLVQICLTWGMFLPACLQVCSPAGKKY